MKSIFKYLAVMAFGVALMCMVSCNKEDDGKTDVTPVTPTPDPRPAGDIALHLGSVNGAYILEGDTVRYTTTDADMHGIHRADVHIFIDNQTSADLAVNHSYEVLQGPAGLNTEVCAHGTCPWNGEVYTIAPGAYENPYTIETHLETEYSGQQILYKIKVGKDRRIDDPVTFYLLINVQ